jgi:hypothetical protein
MNQYEFDEDFDDIKKKCLFLYPKYLNYLKKLNIVPKKV